MDVQRLLPMAPVYARAIANKGCPIANVFALLDGTFRAFCRPARDGYNGIAQRMHYTRHKKHLHGTARRCAGRRTAWSLRHGNDRLSTGRPVANRSVLRSDVTYVRKPSIVLSTIGMCSNCIHTGQVSARHVASIQQSAVCGATSAHTVTSAA